MCNEDNDFENHARRDSLQTEYQIYLSHADNGEGGDITNNGEPLKTFDEWLNS